MHEPIATPRELRGEIGVSRLMARIFAVLSVAFLVTMGGALAQQAKLSPKQRIPASARVVGWSEKSREQGCD
jgi:hypothetical protein